MPKHESGMVEADITINGVELTFAQSMVLRCAVSSMLISMQSEQTKRDLGPISEGYDAHLRQLEALIISGCK